MPYTMCWLATGSVVEIRAYGDLVDADFEGMARDAVHYLDGATGDSLYWLIDLVDFQSLNYDWSKMVAYHGAAPYQYYHLSHWLAYYNDTNPHIGYLVELLNRIIYRNFLFPDREEAVRFLREKGAPM